MRIRFIPLLMVVLLALGTTAAFAESGPKGDGKARHKGVVVLHATETASTYVTADGTVVDEDDIDEQTPPSAGDRFLLVDTLYADEARTQRAGRNDIECTVTEFSGTTEEDFEQHMLCQGVVTLDGAGTLAWQAALHFSAMAEDEFDPEAPFATVAITGGTGDYVGASGQATLFDTSPEGSEESLTRYEVQLKPGRW